MLIQLLIHLFFSKNVVKYLYASPSALKKWKRCPGTLFVHIYKEFRHGKMEMEEECLFLRILDIVCTTQGIRSISSSLFAPPKPFLLTSSDRTPLDFDRVPVMLAELSRTNLSVLLELRIFFLSVIG